MKRFFFVCFLFATSLAAEYITEGYGRWYDHEKRPILLASFLPAFPKILVLTPNFQIYKQCFQQWPLASYYEFSPDLNDRLHNFDLLWMESNGAEIELLRDADLIVPSARLIYTTFKCSEFQMLTGYLNSIGFKLMTIWYFRNETGHGLFVRKDYYDAADRTFYYLPKMNFSVDPGIPLDFESILPKITNKPESFPMEGIDFIYMINLDERPEKYLQTSTELQFYGINPYRFSAVNGWKLSVKVLNQIGLKFAPGSLNELTIGSTFVENNGKAYCNTEFLQSNDSVYFFPYLSLGAIGIVLSHLSVLKDAYDAGYQTIWVMEDDVEILQDPRRIPGLLRELDQLVPDWDIFFTDTDTKDPEGNHVSCRSMAYRPNVPTPSFKVFLDRFYPIGNNFYRTGMRYGAYSMILRRSGIKKILDYYRKYRVFTPYDTDYWLCPDLKMYYYNQDIVSHRPGAFSDNLCPGFQKSEK